MNNYLVGIYGVIGSGKSLALNRLKDLGANVLSCDEENKLLFLDPSYILELKKLFPKAVNGCVDKKKIKEEIFDNNDKKSALEKLSHDRIRKSILEKTKNGLWFIEIPLYIEGFLPINESWIVDAPMGVKINRITERDGITKELALKIINAQPPITIKEKKILLNNGTKQEFLSLVDKEYNDLIKRISF